MIPVFYKIADSEARAGARARAGPSWFAQRTAAAAAGQPVPGGPCGRALEVARVDRPSRLTVRVGPGDAGPAGARLGPGSESGSVSLVSDASLTQMSQ